MKKMSFHIKQKLRKSVLTAFTFIAVGFLLTTILSFSPAERGRFSPEKRKEPQKKASINHTYFTDQFPCFMMPKNYVDSIINKGSGKRKLILKATFNGSKPDLMNMGVIVYWARNQKKHGSSSDNDDILPRNLAKDNTGKCLLTDIKPGANYKLGNNYITIKKIKQLLANLQNEGAKKYAFFRVKVMPGINLSDELVYSFVACYADGTEVPAHPVTKSDNNESKPSPPAPPGGSQ